MSAILPVKDLKQTVLGFNPSQSLHKNTIDVGHPESPERINKVWALLKANFTGNGCDLLTNFLPVDEHDLMQTHTRGYVGYMEFAKTDDQAELNKMAGGFDSVFLSPDSVRAAQAAASCCRHLAEVIWEGKYRNGFALTRPPGHHASENDACGFCIYNNVAQAANTALDMGASRVLIVDLDVHHGNGTQDIFYDDDKVLFFSIHRHENGAFWPYLAKSNYDHIGEHEGQGFNVNVPLNETGCGDADYLAIFWNVLWPLAVEFNPQFVIISAGFDSCVGDPLGGMNLTPDCYSHLVYHLKALAGGKLLMVLEGGYNHQVTAEAVDRCVRVLMGAAPVPLSLTEEHKKSTVISCLNVIDRLRSLGIWHCFDFYNNVGKGEKYALSINNTVYTPSGESSRSNTAGIDQTTLPQYKNDKIPDFRKQWPFFIQIDNKIQHYNEGNPGHPECPQRVPSIYEKIKEERMFDRCRELKFEPGKSFLTREKLEQTHERPYLEWLDRFVTNFASQLQIEAETLKDKSLYLCQSSAVAANNAAGGVIMILDEILTKPGPACGFAAVRPPGHHAGIDSGNGFCLLNNVAIAANHARSKYGLKRIMILDWDVHHGDGTQEIFDQDPEIIFISLHRHDYGSFYPCGPNQDHSYVGSGAGKGFVINIPWNADDSGDSEYLAAFYKIVMPIAYEFNPELVLISAGFDAAEGDPLGGYKVTPTAYSLMTYQLSSLAGGKLLAVLEGGYNLKSVANSAAAVIKTLGDGHPVQKLDYKKLKPVLPRALETLRNVVETQSQHWTSVRDFQVLGPLDGTKIPLEEDSDKKRKKSRSGDKRKQTGEGTSR